MHPHIREKANCGSSACLRHGWRRLPEGGLGRRRTRLASREEFNVAGLHPSNRSQRAAGGVEVDSAVHAEAIVAPKCTAELRIYGGEDCPELGKDLALCGIQAAVRLRYSPRTKPGAQACILGSLLWPSRQQPIDRFAELLTDCQQHGCTWFLFPVF